MSAKHWVAAELGINTACVHVCVRARASTSAIFLFTLGPQINSLPSINLCTNKNLAGRQMQLTRIMGGNRRERAYSYALVATYAAVTLIHARGGPRGSAVGGSGSVINGRLNTEAQGFLRRGGRRRRGRSVNPGFNFSASATPQLGLTP